MACSTPSEASAKAVSRSTKWCQASNWWKMISSTAAMQPMPINALASRVRRGSAWLG